MKTEYFHRTSEDYISMGYNEDVSKEQAELDAKQFAQENPNEVTQKSIIVKKIKGPKGQTKEEQEALLEKFSAYANREPEITANNVDFSKSIDN